MQNSILKATTFVGLLWWVKICEVIFDWHLQSLGIYPLTANGLIGVVTAPLVHGSWIHLINNTPPLLLLGSMLIYGYPRSRWWTLTIIWLVAGTGVWLFGRDSYHFGASGLTHGMFFFLFLSGILRRDRRSIALLMIAFFMYGTMLLTILPRDPSISFESHAFGAVGGVLCALIFRRWDPRPGVKTYSWEQQTEVEDPVIGDQWKIKDEKQIEEPDKDD